MPPGAVLPLARELQEQGKSLGRSLLALAEWHVTTPRALHGRFAGSRLRIEGLLPAVFLLQLRLARISHTCERQRPGCRDGAVLG